jgi:hypothetical protein
MAKSIALWRKNGEEMAKSIALWRKKWQSQSLFGEENDEVNRSLVKKMAKK